MMFIPSSAQALEGAGTAPESATKRLLRAAADGQLVGDDLRSIVPKLVVRIGGLALTSSEYAVLVDLLSSDHLVWIGQRITVTAAGRQRLERLRTETDG
jgi:hypothetical protein